VSSLGKKIIIEAYTPNWSKQFEEERNALEKIVGNKVLAIEHIGSTSVEGLGAKPILDIALGVHDIGVIQSLVEPLKELKYEYVHHREFPERRFFRKGEWRAGTHHLHFYQFEEQHWKDQILFRNYLRKNPDVAKA
jgi:GrpB-like predicted nucleotidyltransferase (UPF0157 family)